MDFISDFKTTPSQGSLVGFQDILKLPARQELLANHGHRSLHFPFVFCLSYASRYTTNP